MKTIYSLKEFKEEVMKIASLVKREYVSVKVEITILDKMEFYAYIDGFGSVTKSTMEECISAMKEKVGQGLPQPNIDVEIEIEEPEAVIENI